jgi:hypothetical protein
VSLAATEGFAGFCRGSEVVQVGVRQSFDNQRLERISVSICHSGYRYPAANIGSRAVFIRVDCEQRLRGSVPGEEKWRLPSTSSSGDHGELTSAIVDRAPCHTLQAGDWAKLNPSFRPIRVRQNLFSTNRRAVPPYSRPDEKNTRSNPPGSGEAMAWLKFVGPWAPVLLLLRPGRDGPAVAARFGTACAMEELPLQSVPLARLSSAAERRSAPPNPAARSTEDIFGAKVHASAAHVWVPQPRAERTL